MGCAAQPMSADRIGVLWLIRGLGPGGAERLLVNHALAADHRRFRYEAVYLVPWKDQLVKELEDSGVAVSCWPAPRNYDLRWILRLRKRLTTDPVAVVHSHSPAVAALARLVVRSLPRRARPLVVSTEHNRWPRYRPTTRFADAATLRLEDSTIAVSDDVRESMPPGLRERAEVLVHGVDVAAVRRHAAGRERIRAELAIAPDEVVIGTVANLRREKAPADLLRAAAQMSLSEVPVRFVSVGQGPLEAEVRALHAELGLDDRFLLLGHRPDALEVMSAFDIFTLSSVHEGLPVALMEALAMGLAVVATEAGGIPQAVTDGREALLVPVRRPDLLAEAFGRVVTDPDLRRRLAGAASHRGAHFDVKPSVRRLEAIYASGPGRAESNLR